MTTKRFLIMLAAIIGTVGAWAQSADEVAVTPTANANEWTLTMPAGNVELEVEYYTPSDLTVGESLHGTVQFAVGGETVTQACYDDVVTVSVTPDAGYSTKDVTVRAYTSWEAAGARRRAPSLLDEIELTAGTTDGTWTFTMPETDVWVVVTYQKNLQGAWIQPIADQTSTGEAIEPAIEVKDGETTLVEGRDYTVAYSDNVSIGTATVTIEAVEGGDYVGEATATFAITGIVVSVPAQSYVTYFGRSGVRLYSETDAALYSVATITESEVVLTSALDAAPAQTPLLIENSANVAREIVLEGVANAEAVSYDAAHFFGTLTDKAFSTEDIAAKNYYVLTVTNDFVWVKDAGTLPAGKCWIELTPASEVSLRHLPIVHEGGTTSGINAVGAAANIDSNWYDLSGRRVAQPTKGIYVKDGKKVLVR